MMFYFMFGSPDFWLRSLCLCMMVFVCGIYVLIDLVQIMTPEAFGMDDYILGALMLYVDLVRMFIYILAILGSNK